MSSGSVDAAGPGDEHAEDVERGVVREAFAGLVEQRDLAEDRHPLVRRRNTLRLRRTLQEPLDEELRDRRREVGGKADVRSSTSAGAAA